MTRNWSLQLAAQPAVPEAVQPDAEVTVDFEEESVDVVGETRDLE